MNRYGLQVLIIGMAIFSMFFGGGNLVFPLWIGTKTASISLSSVGFIISGVLLPFYGILITLYFKGNYKQFLSVWGKVIGQVLVFSLLLFWIPLGSGPRCNQLAFGAFAQVGGTLPLWAYSAIYSLVVYLLTLWKTQFLEILGKVVTPLLIFSLFFLIISLFTQEPSHLHNEMRVNDFISSFFAGYNTMDFIAAIFFASTIISLIKEKQKDKFDMRFILHSCLVAIALLCIIYVGMISVGHAHASTLSGVSRDQLLAVIGRVLFSDNFKVVVFVIITLSVLSTSMALALVFSDYLKDTLFRGKIKHGVSLFLTIALSFALSVVGFDKLAVLISYAMAVLYPVLLLITTSAIVKEIYGKRRALRLEETLTKKI